MTNTITFLKECNIDVILDYVAVLARRHATEGKLVKQKKFNAAEFQAQESEAFIYILESLKGYLAANNLLDTSTRQHINNLSVLWGNYARYSIAERNSEFCALIGYIEFWLGENMAMHPNLNEYLKILWALWGIGPTNIAKKSPL